MQTYLNLVKQVLAQGKSKPNRTGINAITIPGAMIQHDCQQGFPLLTTKKMAFKSIRVELEAFIKGITDKTWLQERGCKIWDQWCNPTKIPKGLNEEDKKKFQLQEKDLGKIYGYQWRNFGGVDQLTNIRNSLKNNPHDRRMIVSAWNPSQLNEMALPPCHILFHLIVIENSLNLTWFQRSCDLMLGLPFNIASYALLLHLLSLENNLIPGTITGMISDVHIYENHLEGAKEQIERKPYQLPQIKTNPFTNILKWDYSHTSLINYQHHVKISLPIAV